ncbi:alpha/beta fold hydrolase [Massilia cavernae]|uniref:Alpha/beta hydrolase n=1 Tax=Massilia cavernae TaxID=2320864 RepID=A0A418X7I8_9BURK|nr:alpha/beta hydrolase [Massilia cavernae]RJG08323.1 alpha/beta hydrolase [Massilia cavernae]
MSNYSEITYTSTDRLSLYARDYAAHSGPARLPVICIHGLTRNSGDFDELAPWIAGLGRRVIAVDVRGRGHSAFDPNPAHYTPMVYANDIVKLAHDLGIGRAVFIGTSMGGIITMTLAMRKLDLIAAAVLNDVGPVLSEKGLSRIAGYAGKGAKLASWQDAAEYIKNINQPAFPGNTMEEWSKWANRAFTENQQGELVLRYDPNIAHAIQTGKLKAASMMAKYAFRRLARSRPTLLVRGALSDLVEPEQASYMRHAAPGMRYAEVPNVGHAPMLTEAPAQEAIREFLSQVD